MTRLVIFLFLVLLGKILQNPYQLSSITTSAYPARFDLCVCNLIKLVFDETTALNYIFVTAYFTKDSEIYKLLELSVVIIMLSL